MQIPLPPRGFAEPDRIEFGRPTGGRYRNALDDSDPIRPPDFEEAIGSLIRQYVEPIRRKAPEASCPEERCRLDEWITWALGEADGMDPLMHSIAELLNAYPDFDNFQLEQQQPPRRKAAWGLPGNGFG